MPGTYYLESVKLGKEFQLNNSSWSGNDCKNYHNQIRVLMDKHDAKTVLDYGCGKGKQYENIVSFGMPHNRVTEPMTFQTRINASSIYKFDPCVKEFEVPPKGQKFDAVICTQVLGSIPDDDLAWVKDEFMNYATKFVFIGLHNPTKPPKLKKRMYDPQYLSHERSVEWYQERFKDWKGPKLYWWFRDIEHPVNDWYSVKKGGLADESGI